MININICLWPKKIKYIFQTHIRMEHKYRIRSVFRTYYPSTSLSLFCTKKSIETSFLITGRFMLFQIQLAKIILVHPKSEIYLVHCQFVPLFFFHRFHICSCHLFYIAIVFLYFSLSSSKKKERQLLLSKLLDQSDNHRESNTEKQL